MCAIRRARRSQIIAALRQKKEAVLPRPGVRDWIYAPDVADAVALLVEARKAQASASTTYRPGMNGRRCNGGSVLLRLNPGLRLPAGQPGEAPTVDLHSDADRAPLSIARMAEEFGWRARFGCADSAADLNEWWTRHGEGM